MVKVSLVLATVIDVALAALLIGVSGFLFGSGPESMHGGALLGAAYAAAVIVCLAAADGRLRVHAPWQGCARSYHGVDAARWRLGGAAHARSVLTGDNAAALA